MKNRLVSITNWVKGRFERNRTKFCSVKSYIILVILFAGLFSSGCTSLNIENIPDKGKWIVIKDEMINPRSPVTANLLPDGNVLIMGGSNNSAADTAEVFDPKQMKIVKRIPLDDHRTCCYSSVSLQNGDVLVLGGYAYKPLKHTNTAKIFDSKTYTFKNVKPMEHKISPISYLLPNNNVLILYAFCGLNEVGCENKRFQVYSPEKNKYIKTKNMIHRQEVGKQSMILENGYILFPCYFRFRNSNDKTRGSGCLYKYKENEFEPHEDFPIPRLFIQLDYENYLAIDPFINYSSGYTYNIKTKEKTPVKNIINRTWRLGTLPQTILLTNGNVLILGINALTIENEDYSYKKKQKNKSYDKYSSYIYDRKENKFYEIPSPPFPVYDAGIIKLQDGNILIAGGYYRNTPFESAKYSNKIQIYKYRQ